MSILAEITAPVPGTWLSGVQTQHVTRNVLQIRAPGEFALDVGQHALNHFIPAGSPPVPGSQQAGLQFGQQVGIMIGLASNHDAVDVCQVLMTLVQRRDAAVQDNSQIREFGF